LGIVSLAAFEKKRAARAILSTFRSNFGSSTFRFRSFAMLEHLPFAIIVVASIVVASIMYAILESVKEVRKMMQDSQDMFAWQQQQAATTSRTSRTHQQQAATTSRTTVYMSKKSNKIHFAGCYHIKDIKDISEYELCIDCIKKRAKKEEAKGSESEGQ